jgi:hypothetical protein
MDCTSHLYVENGIDVLMPAVYLPAVVKAP